MKIPIDTLENTKYNISIINKQKHLLKKKEVDEMYMAMCELIRNIERENVKDIRLSGYDEITRIEISIDKENDNTRLVKKIKGQVVAIIDKGCDETNKEFFAKHISAIKFRVVNVDVVNERLAEMIHKEQQLVDRLNDIQLELNKVENEIEKEL